jgi:hypothetical protein
VSNIASLVWAYGEITDGDNWARRLFGVAGGVYALAGLVNQSESFEAGAQPRRRIGCRDRQPEQ